MTHEQMYGCSIAEGFEKFHKQNPNVYETFKKQALFAIQNGKKKIGAKSIVEWIRWQYFIETKDSDFKINNTYTSYFARMFVQEYPQYKQFFEFRKLKNAS